MIENSTIIFISYPPMAIGLLGLIFCLVRDFRNISQGRGRGQNTAPEIYWFMIVLVIVGLFLGFNWRIALLVTCLLVGLLHPLRKKSKFKTE